ncbi:MAG: GDSL-type esterase/lipase family protein, partial [Actinomycetota bacterium]
AVPALGATAALAVVLRAAHRSDLPSFPNQDASGTFGDPSLPRLRIVCIGDSSLTGPGLDRIDSLFIRRIARSYADRHHVELISLAVGGSKATDVIEGQLSEAVGLSPDIAVISVGSNDAMRGVPVRRYREQLDHILERLGPVSGAMLLVGIGDLGTVPRLPPVLRPYLSYRSQIFNEAATEAAAVNPRAVKVHTRGRMTTAFVGDPALFAGDQFHASDEGHRIFAEETGPAFGAAYRLWRQRTAAGGRP